MPKGKRSSSVRIAATRALAVLADFRWRSTVCNSCRPISDPGNHSQLPCWLSGSQ